MALPLNSRPTLEEIQAAHERLDGVVVRTSMVPYCADPSVSLKLETEQPVRSFKLRGVFNAVASMSTEQRAHGLSTVSAGNTAQALAWCGRYFGVPVRSVMPDTAPRAKTRPFEELGGEPILVPVAEVFAFLKERRWEQEPYAFVHPWIDRDVTIGHATMGLEIFEQQPDLSAIYIPVGGGGLLTGLGAAIRSLAPDAQIIAVEPAGCPALHETLRQGQPAAVECKTICDGVAVPYITAEAWSVIEPLIDEVVLVPDDAVRESMRDLDGNHGIHAEPSGALALAAARIHRVPGQIVCPVTGGSVD